MRREKNDGNCAQSVKMEMMIRPNTNQLKDDFYQPYDEKSPKHGLVYRGGTYNKLSVQVLHTKHRPNHLSGIHYGVPTISKAWPMCEDMTGPLKLLDSLSRALTIYYPRTTNSFQLCQSPELYYIISKLAYNFKQSLREFHNRVDQPAS